ncbi:MAG: hypothetical protein JRE28_15840 [Deltaproteobacteria bacterium]|nr:hypothetical protein [Deltaproteobacteria bacterium]
MIKNEQKALSPEQVVDRYPCLNKGTLANMRMQSRGPRFYKVSRKVVYKPADIEKYLFHNPVLTIDDRG